MGLIVLHQLLLEQTAQTDIYIKKQHWQLGTVGNLSRKLPKMTYQKALKLLGLSDVNPAVFLNDFDVLYFIIKSVKPKHHRKSPRRTESVYKCKWLYFPSVQQKTLFSPAAFWVMSSAGINITYFVVYLKD